MDPPPAPIRKTCFATRVTKMRRCFEPNLAGDPATTPLIRKHHPRTNLLKEEAKKFLNVETKDNG